MPRIFISYRRDDTAGSAGRLAADLRRRFGRSNVFVDIDAIPSGVNFETKIHDALDSCAVVLVLIGAHWLSDAQPDGTRRIDSERDYVRMEVAEALKRQSITVVPVLVEDAAMPAASELPPDLTPLATQNAAPLSTKRWQYDIGQLAGTIERRDTAWRRMLRRVPRVTTRGAVLGVAIALAVGAAVLVLKPSSGSGGQRLVLAPASVAPVVDECHHSLLHAVDGSVAPLNCGEKLNVDAWQAIASFGSPEVMKLGPNATPTDVGQALCFDSKTNRNYDTSIEENAYELARRYNGWNFSLDVFGTFQQTGC